MRSDNFTGESRNQSLDVLRGIAVLLVLGRHYSPSMMFGWCGVDLFFVLSGFLISGLLFSDFKRTGTIHAKRFWIRRGFKIYPSFYALIVVTVIVFLLRAGTVPREILGDIFFIQNYAPRVWEHGWSLAVEEHFYFALPLLFILLLRIGRGQPNPFRPIPLISIAASAICLYLRIVTSHHTNDWHKMFEPTHLRVDMLLTGVALGYYYHFESGSFREARKAWVLIVGLVLVVIGVTLPTAVSGFTFLSAGFACVVAWAANQQTSRNRLIRFLARIGYYSYSIYLWQVVVLIPFYHVPHLWFTAPVCAVCSVMVGVLMAKLIEVPALRLRDRWFPKSVVSKVPPSNVGEPAIRSAQRAEALMAS